MRGVLSRRFLALWFLLSASLLAAPPTITGFTPTSGKAATTVTVTGTYFTGATAVKFNGTNASSFTVASATSITAVAPTGVTTGKISVTTAGGTATSSGTFTVVAAPTISSFTPTSGKAATTVAVTGTNFTGATAVKFNGTNASSFTVVSSTSITAVAPTGVTTGKISVTTAGGTATSSGTFTVVAAPTISSFTPTSGKAATTVTVTGTNFTGATAVKFNGANASSFTVASATSITAVAPTGVTTGKISVTTVGGTATSSGTFTVVATPTITSFTPTSGGAGTSVTITGTNFTGATAVKFNGTNASSFTVASATSITAVAPTSVTTGKISVTTAGGTATSSGTFTVVAAPTIMNFTPASGAAGTSVTISGANLTGATAVKFNGVAASSFSGTTTIAAVAPAGVTTGAISVTTPGGMATSSSSFTAVAAPTISYFITAKTPITAGTSTTLTGTFTGGTGAVDNGVGAVASGIPVTITPAATTTYTLTVTGTGGTVTKQVTVTVVPPPAQPVITGPANVTANQAGYTASVAAQSGCTYAWMVSSGTITAGSTTNQVTFTPKLATIPSLATARLSHTATLLPSGKVLLVGGADSSTNSIASAEVFDPTAKTFSKLAASMTLPRAGHTATLLLSGKVLIAGGYDSTGLAVANAELFDPTSGTFTAVAGSMSVARLYHTATRLSNGKVLLAGGCDSQWNVLASADLYDPATGTLLPVSSLMVAAREGHTATLLSNGQVLLAGGDGVNWSCLASTEIFDPSSGSFLPGASMASARNGHTSTLLPNGQVLLAGGNDSSGACLANVEIYDPVAGTSYLTSSSMNTPRSRHTASLLPNGKVFLTGGIGPNNPYGPIPYLASAEFFDPSTGAFSVTAGSMSLPKANHTATALSTGQILLAGGFNVDVNGNNKSLASADLFNPSIGSFGGTSLSCTVTNGAGTASVPGVLNLVVLPAPALPVLSVPSGVIVGGTGYSASVPAQAGCSYAWTISNGTISDGQHAAVVTFNAGSVSPVTLSCAVANAAGTVKIGSATVSAWPATLALTPATASVLTGNPVAITASQPVSWNAMGQFQLASVTGTQATFSGKSSGGANLPVATFFILATSMADPTLFAIAAVTVTTSGAPVFNAFTASPTALHAGQSTTLSWNAANATSVGISQWSDFNLNPSTIPSLQNLPVAGTVTIKPTQTTSYVITASNALGTVSGIVTVTADLVPMANLRASASSVKIGDTIQLIPTFSNGTARVEPGGLVAQNGVPLVVQVMGSTAYTLTVTNPYGVTATSSAWVDGTGPGAFLSDIPIPETMKLSVTRLLDGEMLFREFNWDNRFQYLGWTPAQIFKPETSAFQASATLGNDRRSHTSTLCADGRVLFYGGNGRDYGYGSVRYDYELFDPVTDTRAQFGSDNLGPGGNANLPRIGHQATLLADGTVLVTGGNQEFSVDSAVLVDVNASISGGYTTFVHATAPMSVSRSNHRAIRLMDGRVLVAGGEKYNATTRLWEPITSAELYDPLTGTWMLVGSLHQPENKTGPILLPDGRVNFGGKEIFDPSTLTFTELPSPYPGFPGFESGSLLLQDGRILMSGDSLPLFYDATSGLCSDSSTPLWKFYCLGQLQDGTVLAGLTNDPIKMLHFDPQARLTIHPAVGHTNVGLPLSMTTTGPAASQGVTWRATSGSITQDGQYLSSNTGLVAVTATAQDGTKATMWVDVHPAVAVKIDPLPFPAVDVPYALKAHVLNTPDQRVVWSLQEGSAAGTITPDGMYTAAAIGTFHAVATSVKDPQRSATLTLVVVSPLTIDPTTATTYPTGKVRLHAVADGGIGNVMWTASDGSTVASIRSAGDPNAFEWTASATPGTYTLTAIWIGHPESAKVVTITVIPPTTKALFVEPSLLRARPMAPNLGFYFRCTAAVGPLSSIGPLNATLVGPTESTTPTSLNLGVFSGSILLSAPLVPGVYLLNLTQTQAPGLMASATLHVMDSPAIVGFTTNKLLVLDGQQYTLSWAAVNGDQAFLDGLPVALSGSLTLTGSNWGTNYLGENFQKTDSLSVQKNTPTPGNPYYDQSSVNIIRGKLILAAPTSPLEVGPGGTIQVPVGMTLLAGVNAPASMLTSTYKLKLDVNWSATAGQIVQTSGSLPVTTSSGTIATSYTLSPWANWQAPVVPGDYTLTATSKDDSTIVCTIPVKVLATGGIAIAVAPASMQVTTGATAQFTHSLYAPTTRVQWSSTIGSVTQEGLFLAPDTPGVGTVTVTSVDDPSKSATAQVTVVQSPVTLAITPKAVTLYTGQPQQFGYSLSAPTNRLTWTCSGGNISATGLYTAPAVPGTYTVTATSVDDPGISDTATATVKDVVLTLIPNAIQLDPGQTLQFGHTYEGPQGSSLVWSASGGTITQTGLYAAPPTTGTHIISVYSTAQPDLVRSATVSVAAPLVQITPGSAILPPGGTQRFQALVRSGTVAWSVVEPNGGSISSEGLYTAPLLPGTYTVKAVSSLDLLKQGTAKVVVRTDGGGGGTSGGAPVTGNPGQTGAQVTVEPGSLEVDAGTYYPFSATVSGAVDPSVTWQILNNPVDARIDDQGVFVSSRRGVYQVKATSVADPTAVVTVDVLVRSAFNSEENPLANIRGYSVTALDNGKILIVGGSPLPVEFDPATTTYSGSAYLYDPETKTYTPTGNLLTARCDHHAVKLQDGRVLIAGGYARWADPWLGGPSTKWKGLPFGHHFPFAEIYDPASGTFQPLPSQAHAKPNVGSSTDLYFPGVLEGPGMMGTNHGSGSHSLLLQDGRVWFAGALYGWNNALPLCTAWGEGVEYFNSGSGLFTNSDSPLAWGLDHSLWNTTLAYCGVENLDDGRVVVSGGLMLNAPAAPNAARSGITLWDPGANQGVNADLMKVKRLGHTVTKLKDGRLLMVGGATGTGIYNNAGYPSYGFYDFEDTATAEIFDPATNTTKLVGSLSQARRHHAAILLPTGQVLIAGGVKDSGRGNYVYPNHLELYDPDTETFSVMDKLDYGLSEPKVALLSTGNVFLAGQIQAPMEAPAGQEASSVRARAQALPGATLVPTLMAGMAVLGQVSIPAGLEVKVTFKRPWVNEAIAKLDWSQLDTQPSRQTYVVIRKRLFDLTYADVPLIGTKQQGYTDDAGKVMFKDLPDGHYRIEVWAKTLLKRGGVTRFETAVYNQDSDADRDIHKVEMEVDIAQGKLVQKDVEILAAPALGQRWSGPFSILWMLQNGAKTVFDAKPDLELLKLYTVWNEDSSINNKTPTSFRIPYSDQDRLRLIVRGDIFNRSDEFNDYVVLHEFGHYVDWCLTQNAAMTLMGDHRPTGPLNYDVTLTYSEGWGDYLSGLCRSSSHYPSHHSRNRHYSTGSDNQWKVVIRPSTASDAKGIYSEVNVGAALEGLESWYGAPRMLQAQAGMAHVDIPHLIAFAGNLNAADGGSQWPALSGVMRTYGIFNASDQPYFSPRILPSDLPLFFGDGLPGESANADDIHYASYEATSSGTRTVTLVIQDPDSPDKRIGDWDLQVFNRSVVQTRTALGSVRQGDTTLISYAFDTVLDKTYILRIMRTVSSSTSLAVGPCDFTIRVQ